MLCLRLPFQDELRPKMGRPGACAGPSHLSLFLLYLVGEKNRRQVVLCRPFATSAYFLLVPGTPVPGYELFRPFGTGQNNSIRMTLRGKFERFDLAWGRLDLPGLRTELCKSFTLTSCDRKSHAFEPDVGAFRSSFPVASLIKYVG